MQYQANFSPYQWNERCTSAYLTQGLPSAVALVACIENGLSVNSDLSYGRLLFYLGHKHQFPLRGLEHGWIISMARVHLTTELEDREGQKKL